MNNLLWNSVPSLAAGVILGSAFAVSGNMINDGEIALYIVNHACVFPPPYIAVAYQDVQIYIQT